MCPDVTAGEAIDGPFQMESILILAYLAALSTQHHYPNLLISLLLSQVWKSSMRSVSSPMVR